MRLTILLIGSLVVGSIAGVRAAEAPTPAAEGPKPAGPPQPWKDMTPQQRGKYMKDVVVPQMKVAFQKFDGDEFKKFGCATCHGKDAKARKFKMPNPDLPELPAAAAGFAELREKKPKMMAFMGDVVKPQMAALLGLPVFDPKRREAGGFACTSCHTKKEQ